MKRHTGILIFLTLTLLTACKNDCRVVKETYGNQKEKIIFTYPNCKDTTYFKREFFFENGQLSSEGYYKNNIQHGEFKRWTETGVLIEEWEMLNGKINGFVQCWHPNGIKKREAMVVKDIKNGIWKDWDESGELVMEGNFKDGKKNGKWTFWENDGTWILRTYLNDTLWGETYEYIVDSLKITHVVGQYEKGVETGLWKWFDSDSVLSHTAIFTNGEYTGEFIEYYTNGTIKSKGYLLNGDYDGEVNYFDEQGNNTKKVNYKKGTKINEKNYGQQLSE